jgi:hypothetical protein
VTSDPHKKAKDKLKDSITKLEDQLVAAESEGNTIAIKALKKSIERLKRLSLNTHK